MRTAWMALAVIPLLLLPPASAGVRPVASGSASSVFAREGDLQGPLAGALWQPKWVLNQSQPVTVNRVDPVAVPILALQAGHARITRYSAEFYGPMRTDYVRVENRTLADNRASPEVMEVSGLRLLAPVVGDADSARVIVLPMPGAAALVQVEGPLRANKTEGPSEDSRGQRFDGGQTFKLDLSDVASVYALSSGGVALTGSFRLVLDSVDLPFESDEGRAQVTTREEFTGSAYVGTTTVAAHWKIHEAFVDLWNATLVLGGDAQAFFSRASLRAPALDLHLSTGTVRGKEVSGEDVHLEGNLVASLVGNGAGYDLTATVEGQVDGLAVGGPSAAQGSGAAVANPSGAFPGALSLLALPSIPALHWASSRRRFTRMDQALDRGDFATALRLANRFTPWPGQRQDSVLAAAICLLGLGRPAEACQRLEGRRWSVGRRPMRDFLRARGHAALGQVDAAVRALAASLMAEPALIGQARTDPVLATLMDGPRDPANSSQEAYA